MSGSPPMLRRTGDAVALVTLLVPYALLAHRFWFVTDDAYISFRYARHWAMGMGLRFNPDDAQPVEGFSNFLWVALATLCESVGIPPEQVLLWLSFSCGALLLIWVFRVLRDTGLDPLASLVATAFAGWSPAYALHASTGLETLPYSLVMFALFHRLVIREQGIDMRGALICGVALTLLRVEGFFWWILMLALCSATRARAGQDWRRPVAILATCAVLLAVAVTAARVLHFGDPIPNTVRAKAGFGPERLARGFAYLAHFLTTFVTPAAFLVAAPWCGYRSLTPRTTAAIGMALAIWGYAVAVGGDFMAMGRFLVPSLAFVALTIGAALAQIDRQRVPVLGIALVTLMVGFLPAWNLHLAPERLRSHFHIHGATPYITDYERFVFQRENALRWVRRGQALARFSDPSPRPSVVLGAIGATGYYSGLTVFDQHGLIDREVARQPVKSGAIPGHERYVSPGFFLARSPTFLFAELSDGASPAAIARTLQRNAQVLRKAGLEESYVPRALRLDGPEERQHPEYLLVGQRIPAGRDPDRAWRRYERTQTQLSGSGATR
ncbi:hypothetical protein MK489_17805 [Myxococcota bacterium]|nr:hypothetical protein [Myxococcota bacterium]